MHLDMCVSERKKNCDGLDVDVHRLCVGRTVAK